MASQRKRICYISIDIETTGADMRRDQLFAIAIAYADSSAKNKSQIRSWKAILNLGKPKDCSWEDFWKVQGFEQRCYDEFWSKNEDMLNSLQRQATIHTDMRDLIAAFNEKLKEIEEEFDETVIVIDCICFDPVWVSAQLMLNGFKALNYSRAGKYRSSYDVDSMIESALHVDSTYDWKMISELKQKFIDGLLPELGQHANTHDPEEDATNILVNFFRIREYNSQQLEREQIVRDYLQYLRSTGKSMEFDATPSVTRDVHIRNLLKQAPSLEWVFFKLVSIQKNPSRWIFCCIEDGILFDYNRYFLFFQ